MDWVVVRNRTQHIEARNQRRIDLALIAREERDVGAFGGEDLEDLEADAARTAVHDDFLALETQIHRALHPQFIAR
jgi:hypothetical protein